MLVRNQYIYSKTTIEENEQKITVTNSIVRLRFKIGVLCLVRLYTSKDPKHDHMDFIRTDYRAANAHKGFTITPNVNYKCPRSVAAIALPVAAIALPQPPIYLKLT